MKGVTLSKFAPLNLSSADLNTYTREWQGDRFTDGRPKVSDHLLELVRNVTITQTWGVLRTAGYHHQYEDGRLCTHPGGHWSDGR